MPRPRAYWIRLDHGVHDHPKVIALAGLLGTSRVAVVGHLTRLWLWCSAYRPNGRTEGLTDQVLSEAAAWTGDPNLWRSSLIAVKLLDIKHIRGGQTRGEHLHGWLERNGYQQREARRKRDTTPLNDARKPRVSRGIRAPRDVDETYVDDTRQTGEEAEGAEPSEDGRSTPPTAAFPVVGKGPDIWAPPPTLLLDLARAFPALDVPGETAKARAWCVTNPEKRKTAGGMPRFLYAWMAREQNDGRSPKRKSESILSPKGQATAAAAKRWIERTGTENPT